MTGTRCELNLIGDVHVVAGEHRVEIPEGGRRLVVYIALHGGRVERRRVAGTLWPIGGDARAAGNLRSALWRLRGAGLHLLDADNGTLSLASHVVVDIDLVGAWAARLVAGRPEPDDLALRPGWSETLDLLPGWYDDWALMERERVRQRVLHGLEALSRLLRDRARHADAVDVAMAVVEAEPLRESAQRVLVEAHLAESNRVEAQRCFHLYRDLLHRELGVSPSSELAALVMPGVAARRAGGSRRLAGLQNLATAQCR